MTDFHMPDSWYDPPGEETCVTCNDEGCISCDARMLEDHLADVQMQAIKDGEGVSGGS